MARPNKRIRKSIKVGDFMLYNTQLKKPRTNLDCLSCEYFDKAKKKCNGFGKACFEYDPLTNTLLDPITRMPLKKKVGE